MTSKPSLKPRRRLRSALTVALAAVGLAASPSLAQAAATPTYFYVAPTGSGTACSANAPCSLTQAKAAVEAADGDMSGNIVVQLASGTYSLTSPLTLGAADSGTNGYNVLWQAAPGAIPIISGGSAVTGWSIHDSANNIWSAPVPVGNDSRQLYMDGAPVPRASIAIPRSDVAFTTTGMTIENSSLDYLASLPEQSRIEIESQDSFTDRYSPVQSISGTTITMQQPAWDNNNWGYDTLSSPFEGGQMYLENAYSFLQTGQWYLDPQAGELYYKAPAGWSPSGHDIELPHLTSLVQIGGSYSAPAHNLVLQGLRFSYTTWLTPGTSIGYADEQSGTFIPSAYTQPSNFLTSCQSGCQDFEATRNGWNQVPAAVQVAAATSVSFAENTFSDLGQVGLGIGNDNDATASGTGLGASDVTVSYNTFTNDSGSGIVVGGVQPNAHHPSNPAMTDKDITIADNLVTGVAQDYKDMAGILSTYVTHAVIEHNEVSNLPYDGIDVGWGWGINDPGGSQDYVNRGTYNYQPIYTTPTTLSDTVVSHNLVHGTKKVFHDGGSIYNLSANPGAVVEDNYVYDNDDTVGLYLDEGSRYVTEVNNVVQDTGVWAFTNANAENNTDDNTFTDNWYNSGATEVSTGSPHYNVLNGNVQVSGTSWPAAAEQVIAQAGVQSSGELHAVGAGKCLDVDDFSTTPGTQMQIWDCNAQSNQTWTYTASHQLTVYSGSATMCLDAAGGATTAGTKVDIAACTGGTNQQWLINPDGSLTGAQSGLCVDVSGAGTSDGTLVDLWSCNGQSNQRWILGDPAFAVQPGIYPSGDHQLVIGNDSLCLDVSGAGTSAGTAIDQNSCSGETNQQFQFVPVSGGYGELQAENSGDDVVVSGSSSAAGQIDIVQQAPNGSASSLWLPSQQSDGSWQFQNQSSGLCLDVYGAGSNTGQQLDQYACKNTPGSNQDFLPE